MLVAPIRNAFEMVSSVSPRLDTAPIPVITARRIDVVELVEIARVLKADAIKLVRAVVAAI